ncbi:MAG: diguanylate cyclase [Arenimonas sp.]
MPIPDQPAEAAHHRSVHWTVKTNYRFRTGSFLIIFLALVAHGSGKAYSPLLWSLLALQLLVYPHLAFWRARHARDRKQAEIDNMTVDSLLFGLMVAVLQFPLWISFSVYLASTVNLTISRGVAGWFRSQAFFFGGALLLVAILGWHPVPDTEWRVTALCILGNAIYLPSVGIAAFRGNQKLRKAREALWAGEQALKQQLVEIRVLRDQLQEQATRDPLTGLHNRRFLDVIEARELALCKRENKPLTLIMVDVDHFKEVNDTYGHPAGDEVLQGLANLLLEKVRATDVVCRYGGEEFLLLLPNMPPEIALLRANEWRLAFAQRSFDLGDTAVQVTVSMGIASSPQHGETFSELIRFADQALYRAKAEGRNRALLYCPDP